MATKLITGADVVQKVREIAAADPEHVYWREDREVPCTYVGTQTSEACIVGRALTQLGIPRYCLEHQIVHVKELLNVINIQSTPKDADWLLDVQALQDVGYAWGKAVEQADTRSYARALGEAL